MAGKRNPTASTPEDDFPYDRCCVQAGTKRCYFPASIYGLAAKRGTGECRLHDGTRGHAVIEIIEESERWYDARRRGDPVPMHYTRSDGRRAPGYPSREQEERDHTAKSTAACESMGLVTTEAKRNWCRTRIRDGVLAKTPRLSREPGQDDEEVTA